MQEKRKKTAGQISYTNAVQAIKAGDIKSVYLLHGDEGFLIADLIKRIKSNLLDETSGELDFSVYDADGSPARVDWVKLRSELQTPPFLSKRRVILVKNSGLFKGAVNLPGDQQVAMEDCLSTKASWVCLILKEEKVDKRVKKLLALVEKNNAVLELARMDINGLMNWIAAYLKRYELRISKLAAESLIDRCESDLSSLSNELNKLRLYAQSEEIRDIDQELVDLVSKPDLRADIFSLTGALAQHNTAEALQIYRLLRQNKEAGVLILFMLARHIKQLACAKSAGNERLLAPLMKLPPFVLSRLVQQSRSFNDLQLAEMYSLCRKRDQLIKWGKMDEDIALESLIIGLAASLR